MRAWLCLGLLVGCAKDDPDGAGGDTDSGTEEPSGYVPELPDVARYVSCEVELAQDDGDDGTVDDLTHYVYDELGWTIRRERDDLADGSPEWIETWSGRNAFGRYERYVVDDVIESTGDLVEEHAYDGHLYLWTTVDEGADGTIEERSTFTVGDGVYQAIEIDEGDDGTVDVEGVYTYDALWRQLRHDRDRALDGTVDEWWESTWDNEDDDTREIVHEDEEGNVDTTRFEYEGDRLMFYAFDSAEFAAEYTYTYDGDSDRIERLDLALWLDGEPYYTGVTTYTWDAEDRVLSELSDITLADGGAAIVWRTTYDWDCP